MSREKIFKCHTKGCDNGTDEAPGWCVICEESANFKNLLREAREYVEDMDMLVRLDEVLKD